MEFYMQRVKENPVGYFQGNFNNTNCKKVNITIFIIEFH